MPTKAKREGGSQSGGDAENGKAMVVQDADRLSQYQSHALPLESRVLRKLASTVRGGAYAVSCKGDFGAYPVLWVNKQLGLNPPQSPLVLGGSPVIAASQSLN